MITSTTLGVNGMTCSGCENNIQFALTALSGVSTVAADQQAKTVTIDYDPDIVDQSALTEAIEAMGYDLVK